MIIYGFIESQKTRERKMQKGPKAGPKPGMLQPSAGATAPRDTPIYATVSKSKSKWT